MLTVFTAGTSHTPLGIKWPYGDTKYILKTIFEVTVSLCLNWPHGPPASASQEGGLKGKNYYCWFYICLLLK